MMPWYSLKKGTEGVHVAYAHGDTTLLADTFEIRPGDPFDVSLDFGPNLRTRNKLDHTYIDAQDVHREIATLKSLHISDATVIKGIANEVNRLKPGQARLRVLLNGEHWFSVSMESQGDGSLVLTVLSSIEKQS